MKLIPDHLRWPAIRLAYLQVSSRVPARSRFGGIPDVPEDFDWPVYRDTPLDFLLQIDLKDIAEFRSGFALPTSGRLLFFYDTERQPWGFDPADRHSSCVIYLNDDIELRPAESSLGRTALLATDLAFSQIETVPNAWSPWLDELDWSDDDRFEIEEQNESLQPNEPQIGGHPFVIQNSMEAECELASSGINTGEPEAYGTAEGIEAEKEARNWRLLLQLPSDETLGMMWGDGGNIYFWIKEDALAKRDFDRTWLILQCY